MWPPAWQSCWAASASTKFYLGYTTAGFITLAITIVGGVFTLGVTAAVMAIVGVVEGVLYLTVSQSTFECTHVEHVREWF